LSRHCLHVDERRPLLLHCEIVKGESAIWNVLLSATGASFLIVAVALVAYSMRSPEDLGASDTVVAASADPELAGAGAADAGPDAAAATEPVADAAPGDGSAAEDAADAATEDSDDPDGGSVVAASSAPPGQKPLKSKPSKSKPIKTKTRRPR
jgi:hypothetical protein